MGGGFKVALRFSLLANSTSVPRSYSSMIPLILLCIFKFHNSGLRALCYGECREGFNAIWVLRLAVGNHRSLRDLIQH